MRISTVTLLASVLRALALQPSKFLARHEGGDEGTAATNQGSGAWKFWPFDSSEGSFGLGSLLEGWPFGGDDTQDCTLQLCKDYNKRGIQDNGIASSKGEDGGEEQVMTTWVDPSKANAQQEAEAAAAAADWRAGPGTEGQYSQDQINSYYDEMRKWRKIASGKVWQSQHEVNTPGGGAFQNPFAAPGIAPQGAPKPAAPNPFASAAPAASAAPNPFASAIGGLTGGAGGFGGGGAAAGPGTGGFGGPAAGGVAANPFTAAAGRPALPSAAAGNPFTSPGGFGGVPRPAAGNPFIPRPGGFGWR